MNIDGIPDEEFLRREHQSRCSKILEDLKGKLRAKETREEYRIRMILEAAMIRFSFQRGFYSTKKFRIVDFCLFRPFRIFLEVDGDYHNTPQQKKLDEEREQDILNKNRRQVSPHRMCGEFSMIRGCQSLPPQLSCLYHLSQPIFGGLSRQSWIFLNSQNGLSNTYVGKGGLQ
jgi:very-short-patch-repair endonuclease